MFLQKTLLVLPAMLLFFCSICAQTPQMELNVKHNGSIFKTGEPIEFTAKFTPDSKLWIGKAKTSLYFNGKIIESKEFNSGDSIEQTAKSDKPASIVWKVSLFTPDGKPVLTKQKQPLVFSYGVMVDPFAIRPASARPADFEKRWTSEIAAMRKQPMEVQHIKVDAPVPDSIHMEEISISLGKDIFPATGWLVMPKNAAVKSLPIYVSIPGANLFPYDPKRPPIYGVNRIIFHANPHGFPIQNCDRNFYAKNYASKSGGYATVEAWHTNGIDKPTQFEKMYYRTVILRLIRAMDYLKTLPQWDGKTIQIDGISQGGGLTLIVAALDPAVTNVTAYVPALCDHGAASIGRQSGWPRAIRSNYSSPELKKNAIAETAYLDVAHFAPMIKCRVSIYTGLIDSVCSPTSVFAAINSLPESTPKKIGISPLSGHTSAFQKLEILKNTLPNSRGK